MSFEQISDNKTQYSRQNFRAQPVENTLMIVQASETATQAVPELSQTNNLTMRQDAEVKIEEGNIRDETETIKPPRKVDLSSSERLRQSQSEKEASVIAKLQQKVRKVQLKVSEPTQSDLCQALLYIKKAVPHRSMQKTIIKLYQTTSSKQSQLQSATDLVKSSTSSCKMGGLSNGSVVQSVGQNQMGRMNAETNGRFEKIVLPGKRTSCYHDIAGDFAAASNELYKNRPPNLQQLEALQKNIQHVPIFSRPRPQVIISQTSKVEKTLNTSQADDVYYNFKQSETRRNNIANKAQEQKYEERRRLAKIFVQRGFGITKSIDEDLPPVDIGRQRYRNLMGGILIATFRKLESLMAGELGLTIKYLDTAQMKKISLILINCRVHLEPNHCQTFLQMMQVTYGLADVTLSATQVKQLYVDIMKHLYGKNMTTMEELVRIGKINNRRNLQQKVNVLKRAAYEQQRTTNDRYSLSGSANDNKWGSSTLKYGQSSVSQEVKIERAQDRFWNQQIDHHLVRLYLQYKDLNKIQRCMQDFFSNLQGLTLDHFCKRINTLTIKALRKIKDDASRTQKEALSKMNEEQMMFIATSNQLETLKNLALSYLQKGEVQVLGQCVEQLKNVLKDYGPQGFSELFYEGEDTEVKFEGEESGINLEGLSSIAGGQSSQFELENDHLNDFDASFLNDLQISSQE